PGGALPHRGPRMSRIFVGAALLALVISSPGLRSAAPPPKPASAVKAELARLQGAWENPRANWRLTITGDKWVVTDTKTGRVVADATFKIAPSKSPKQIDVNFKRFGLRYGIYKIEGDTLTHCQGAVRGMPAGRPKDFKGSGRGTLL